MLDGYSRSPCCKHRFLGLVSFDHFIKRAELGVLDDVAESISKMRHALHLLAMGSAGNLKYCDIHATSRPQKTE
ncbi:hypothetical protein CQ018_05465 [Arthrobacter sp. MYb227]|nr:hypothetical protein CQ018_05465 [Arthrobacter sp. MYb227]